MLTQGQLLTALNSVLEFAEDLLVDVPKFWDFLAHIIAPVLSAEAVDMKILKDSADAAKLSDGEMGQKCAGGKYVAAVLHEMAKQGQSPVARTWMDSGLSWEDFLGSSTDKEEFLRSNKLEWTQVAGVEGANQEEVSEEQTKSDIYRVLTSNKDSNEKLYDWLDTHLGERLKTPAMIRLLTTAVAESCIDGIGGQCKLNENQLKLRNPVLKKYLDGQSALEMQALLALQHLMHRLEHPNKLLHSIFEKMYDEDILSEEALILWEKNEDPAEQEGKGVALKSTTQFFIWLKEAEEDED